MFTKLFWKDTLERAISTAAQFALAVIGLSENGFGVITQNASLVLIGYAALSGFVLAILKALAALHFTDGNSASLTVDNVKEK